MYSVRENKNQHTKNKLPLYKPPFKRSNANSTDHLEILSVWNVAADDLIENIIKHLGKALLDEFYQGYFWWKHINDRRLYLLYYEKNNKIHVVSFATVSPLQKTVDCKHADPHSLDYIYTVEKQRRKGHALKLLLHIKKEVPLEASSIDDASYALLEKAGFTFSPSLSLFQLQ